MNVSLIDALMPLVTFTDTDTSMATSQIGILSFSHDLKNISTLVKLLISFDGNSDH